MGKELANGEQW